MSATLARIDEITKALEDVIAQAGLENGIVPGSPLHDRAQGLLADMKTSLDQAAEESLEEIKALEEEEKRRAEARKLRHEEKKLRAQPPAATPPPFGDGFRYLDPLAIREAITGLTADLQRTEEMRPDQDLWEE